MPADSGGIGRKGAILSQSILSVSHELSCVIPGSFAESVSSALPSSTSSPYTYPGHGRLRTSPSG